MDTFIEIRYPTQEMPPRIPVERIPLGLPGDYKPNVAMMPDGELLVAAFRTNSDTVRERFREDILLCRSRDSGCCWSEADNLGETRQLPGREPYLSITRDGAILITCHFLIGEERNDRDYVANFVHRSADGGKTWTTVEVQSDRHPPGTQYGTTRNILELADGTLLHVVTTPEKAGSFLWKTADGGQTWRDSGPAGIVGLPEGYPYGVFEESHLLQLLPFLSGS